MRNSGRLPRLSDGSGTSDRELRRFEKHGESQANEPRRAERRALASLWSPAATARQWRRFCAFRPRGDGALAGSSALAACASGCLKEASGRSDGETDSGERDERKEQRRARREAALGVPGAGQAPARAVERQGKALGTTEPGSLQRLYRHDGWPDEGELVNSQGLALRTYTWWPCKCNPFLVSLSTDPGGESDAAAKLEDRRPPVSPSPLSSSSSSSSLSSFGDPQESRRGRSTGWGAERETKGGPGRAREGQEPRRRSEDARAGNSVGAETYLVGENGELQRDRVTGVTACTACNSPIRGVVILVHGYGEHCRSHFLQKLPSRPSEGASPEETETGRRPVTDGASLADESDDLNEKTRLSSFSASSSPSSSSSSSSSSLGVSTSSDLPSAFAPGPESSLGSLFYENSWVHALNTRGFLVVGFDLQGHGMSGAWRGLRCVVSELDDFARDALLVVLWTQRRFGSPDRKTFPVHLLGLSMGGWAAARALELAGDAGTVARCRARARGAFETPNGDEETGEAETGGGAERSVRRATMSREDEAGEARCARTGAGEGELGAFGEEADWRDTTPFARAAAGVSTEEGKEKKERVGGEERDTDGQLPFAEAPGPLSPASREFCASANDALGLTGLILVSPMFDLERRKAKLKWELAKYGIIPLAAFFPGVPLELFAPWRRLRKDRKRKRVAEYERLRLSFQADPLTFKASPPGALVAAIMRGAQRALDLEEVEKITARNVEKILILHNAGDTICDVGGAVQFFERLGAREKESRRREGERESGERLGSEGAHAGRKAKEVEEEGEAEGAPEKRRGANAPQRALILLNVGATEQRGEKREEFRTDQRKDFDAFLERARASRHRDALDSPQGAEGSRGARGARVGDSRGSREPANPAEGRQPTRAVGYLGEREKGGNVERLTKGKVEEAREAQKEIVTFVENVDVWHNLANEPGHANVFALIDGWLQDADTEREKVQSGERQADPAAGCADRGERQTTPTKPECA
ncbi:conserved hypothetical protein [Neospora caninum Liverpool]|uniref:Serine aminopeptidase S33 domain-containing protein n=1 Tax=Neospora caninum (strain Liverpool) TaxID=572307 RepID=F0VHH8_NEOCL|nr:conserved hypothetical protein [Neospora caninum Liverpool]CBZ53172.1 conserved hypothetical protein [Neospora caninum Liverpool]|eukprot:XP_003883204.1 conserved hypothetical protein [Neospora caninum Liverpool]